MREYWPDALHATLELVARIAAALKDEFKVRVNTFDFIVFYVLCARPRGAAVKCVLTTGIAQAYLPEVVPSMISVLSGASVANTVAVLRRLVDLGPLLVDFVHLIIPELARLVESASMSPTRCGCTA